jgi:hypothetical protein
MDAQTKIVNVRSSVQDKAKDKGLCRHKWKTPDDTCLIDIMKEHSVKGDKEGTGFSKQAWKEILVEFNTKRGLFLELQQIKNRHKYYRSCYRMISRLMKITGFGWNDTDKVITASKEAWDAMILVSFRLFTKFKLILYL